MAPLRSLFEPTSTKPESASHVHRANVGMAMIRGHFTITSWLLIGAALQSILVLLPISRLISILPVLTFLLWRIGDHALISYEWKSNPYIEGVIHGKVTALIPGPKGEAGKPGDGKICVVLLTARSNAPNGVFDKTFQKLGAHNQTMNDEIRAKSLTNGFLGSTSWMNTSENRTTSSELMTVYYFTSREAVHAFAHSPVHRAGWDWWIELVRDKGDACIGITHELYEVDAGKWENIYANMRPTGFATTAHPFVDAEGVQKWASPIVDANRGAVRSSRGRQALTDGSDNEKLVKDYYDDV